MTRNEKLALRNIAIFVGIKIGIAVGVHYASKALIKKLSQVDA